MSTNMLRKSLFKPGTPKSVKDRDLDARKRIITERPRRICMVAYSGSVLIRELMD
jgi:hypothetical protein